MTIKLQGSSSGHVSLDAKATAANNTITLPDTANGELVAADSSGHINLADNKEIKSGTGGDLRLYHDSGGISYLKHSHSGGEPLQIHSNGDVKIKVADTEDAIVAQSNGAVKLYHNNATKIETIATGVNVTGGIRLGGNNAVNELDDYEEGSWTPTWNNVTTTTASSVWRYVKVGRLVTVMGRFQCDTTTNNATHSVWISNLPFTTATSLTNNISDYVSAVSTSNINTDGQNITTYMGNNSTVLEFFHLGDSAAWDSMRSSDVPVAGQMIVTQTYMAA